MLLAYPQKKNDAMYAHVKLLNGFVTPFTYRVPEDQVATIAVGTVVRVPLRNKIVPGLVIKLENHLTNPVTFSIKNIIDREPFPEDPHYFPYIETCARYYQIEPLALIKRLKGYVQQKEFADAPTENESYTTHPITLTDEQQRVVDFTNTHITQGTYAPILLQGVTGSGKTEVYKKALEYAYALGKSTVFLLPEISLATHFAQLLRTQVPHVAIFSFHSATPVKEKKQLWSYALAGTPMVIVGVHMPILLPIKNLGLIIVDEEHDTGYQEKKYPKINSKEIALIRAQKSAIPILLGSATPAIASVYNVTHKGWHFFQLKKRFGGQLPSFELVLLNKKKKRTHFWLSQELVDALADRLEKKEQSIIFLNRRGYYFFLQCASCSLIITCHACSVSLTVHDDGQLHCHYCGHSQAQPAACPACATRKLISKGIGTQQVVTLLQDLFPKAHIARADMDTTSNKKKWQETVTDILQEKIDILVGTQTITKGYHFPSVTLVGLLWADINLHFPIFNAAETTLQQLIQVAGRAGRQGPRGHVIIQAFLDHPIFSYLHEARYLDFCTAELEQRVSSGYPPIKRLVEIAVKHENEDIVEKDARLLAQQLKETGGNAINVLGPAKPPVHKVHNVYTRKIYIKADHIERIIRVYEQVLDNPRESALFFTPNPITL